MKTDNEKTLSQLKAWIRSATKSDGFKNSLLIHDAQILEIICKEALAHNIEIKDRMIASLKSVKSEEEINKLISNSKATSWLSPFLTQVFKELEKDFDDPEISSYIRKETKSKPIDVRVFKSQYLMAFISKVRNKLGLK